MNTTNMISEDSLAEKFRVVTRLGEMMIKNGGEIFRAEASMRYAAKAYGLTEFEPYVLANGIFCSFCEDGKVYSSRILSIPLSPIALSRVDELNTLSRRIATGNCTIAEADAEMNRIEKMNTGSTWMMLAGGAIGAGAFSILFSGTWRDGICALLAGLILELYLCFLIPHTSFPKIMTNISGAFLMSTVCCILYRLGIGDHLDLMTIGPVFVMTPGVPITNAIRNFMENDYLSGMSRFLDALLVAGSIAIGTGASMQCWNYLIGGIL